MISHEFCFLVSYVLLIIKYFNATTLNIHDSFNIFIVSGDQFVCWLVSIIGIVFSPVRDHGESVRWIRHCFTSQNRSFPSLYLLCKISVRLEREREKVCVCVCVSHKKAVLPDFFDFLLFLYSVINWFTIVIWDKFGSSESCNFCKWY